MSGLATGEPGHGLDERLDRKRLAHDRIRAEPIDLLHRLFVRRANNDRCLRKPLLDLTDERSCETAVVSLNTSEIGDDEIGSRVRSSALKIADEDELIALIAQDLAKKVSYRPIVFDDQDLSNVRQAGGFFVGAQF